MKKLILKMLLFFLISIMLTSCSENDNTVESIKKKGKLTMATEATFEPFEFRENGKITGIDIDIAQKIAEELDVELDIQEMEFGSLLAAVSKGKVDFIAAGLSVNEDRKKSIDFSVEYFNASQVIIVKNDSSIKSKSNLVEKKLGVQQGTIGDEEASKIENTTIERYTKTTDAIEALNQNKLDSVIMDNFPAKIFVSKNSDLQILDETLVSDNYAIGIKKDNTSLKKTIDKVLTTLKDNGELDKIIDKYIETE
ncbi:MAG: transporter substrate-binding domain-containing protein [Clostridiales bacterium]